MKKAASPFAIANIRYFIAFRVFYNSRFYYPVFTILFLDYGLTIEQFALLNSVWAATIVLAEVPSGALADIIGRKQLLMTTSILMVGEMLLLSFVPLADISLVFWAFLINRILSGLGEAMASGADEALAYDSLLEQGGKEDWPRVLSVMMRIKSLVSVLTMTLGALIYDPDIVNKILAAFNSSATVTQQVSMRFPIYLTFVLGLFSCVTVLLMKETDNTARDAKKSTNHFKNLMDASRLTLRAGLWIIQTPFALVVILFAMTYDHILRMIITMTSQYLRLIHLPEASFGIIGAATALLGLFIPKIAEKMVRRYTPVQNILWLAGMTFAALIGMAVFIPYLGLIPLAFVSSGLLFTSFFTSHYLNRITESHQRATVLSFKGLAFNLAYGLIGVAFALLIVELRNFKRSAHPEWTQLVIENNAFESAIGWFTPYTVVVLIIIILFSKFVLGNTDIHKTKG
jgi:MFS family permease